jgi:MoaA/NifB/PqqE/SkfB family radical SAM enzyme
MKEFYCAAPWRGLHINPQGKVKTCCAGAPNILGDLHSQGIEQILNGEAIKEIRSSLKNGIPHKYCSNCVAGEAGGAASERNWHNQANLDFDIQNASLEYEYPVIVDIRWNTTCNLSCSYCDQMSSSKWAALKKIPFKSDNRDYYEDVCNFLQQHQDHIKEVALIGGEPFLLNENYKLLDVIPNETTITLITNLSIDLESNKIFQKISQRPRVGWSMSFENIGPAFEYVRYGARWEKLLHNLDLVQNLMKTQGHWGGIHAVYNLFSATRLCELQQFALDRGLTILWQNLHYPLELDPRRLGPMVAKLARDEIAKLKNNFELTPADFDLFSFIDNQLSQTTDQDNLSQKCQTYISNLETTYHSDKQGQFSKIWPELHLALFES